MACCPIRNGRNRLSARSRPDGCCTGCLCRFNAQTRRRRQSARLRYGSSFRETEYVHGCEIAEVGLPILARRSALTSAILYVYCRYTLRQLQNSPKNPQFPLKTFRGSLDTFFRANRPSHDCQAHRLLPLLKLDQVIDWQPIEQYLNRQKTRYLRDHPCVHAYPLLS